jgi:anti-sigma regulatory factor (Ser/Thr protein kinase)
MTPDRHLELSLGATPAEVVRGCDALREFCRAHGLTDAVAFDAALVLEEVSTNVVNHGYAGARPGNVSVKAEILADTLRIEVQDDGPAFNPLSAPAPDMATYWSESRVGGLGLHIVRALVEGVEYTRRGQRNCLVLTLPLGSRS